MTDLTGSRCVVVGEGPLLAPCAHQLAALGAMVAVVTTAAAVEVVSEVVEVRADYADWETARSVVEGLATQFGGLDVLITLPVAQRAQVSFLEQDPDSMSATVQHLFFGVVAMVRAAVDVMAPGGRIVNVVSHTGSIGAPDAVVYDACQAAVQSLGRNIAQELPDLGLTVVTVATGLVAGSEASLMARHSLGRYASPAEIADMVAVAASRMAEFAHGSVIGMTGGLE